MFAKDGSKGGGDGPTQITDLVASHKFLWVPKASNGSNCAVFAKRAIKMVVRVSDQLNFGRKNRAIKNRAIKLVVRVSEQLARDCQKRAIKCGQ